MTIAIKNKESKNGNNIKHTHCFFPLGKDELVSPCLVVTKGQIIPCISMQCISIMQKQTHPYIVTHDEKKKII